MFSTATTQSRFNKYKKLHEVFYLEMIWSGSLAYETARTECNKSWLMLIGVGRVGSAEGSDPIGSADLGACGPPPTR